MNKIPLVVLVAFLMLLAQNGFSQQRTSTPKEQIGYLEQSLESYKRDMASIQNKITSLQNKRSGAVRGYNGKRSQLKTATTKATLESYQKDMDRHQREIQDCDNAILNEQQRLAKVQNSIQETQFKLQGVRSETSAKMNDKKIELSLREPKEIEEKIDSEYTHARLTIPESKLTPQALRQWRLVQENERKCQYLRWRMKQVEEKYNESKDTVAAVYDGGIPDHVAGAAMQNLKREYDKYNKIVKSSGNTVRLAAKRIQDEMNEKGEKLEGVPKDEYLAWASNNGKSVIIAKFVSYDGSSVTLEAPNGKQQTLDVDRFWEEEEMIFKKLAKGQKKQR